MQKRNKGFTCLNCKKYNPPHSSSERNHCKYCLYSKHLDLNIPGDRKSKCLGIMKVIKIDFNSKKGYMLIHKCIKCGKINKNKVMDDDDFDKIIEIQTETNKFLV
jgi:DNA-directed RNA polymerase subunit RPC12/RpoP